MRLRSMFFVLFLAVMVVGFLATGTAQALSFDNWEGTWFKVKMSETGKAGPVVPPGGEVDTNNEKTTTSYLKIESFGIEPDFIESIGITVPVFVISYCVPDGLTWRSDLNKLPILGGEPEKFLSIFTFIQETTNIDQSNLIPLEIKGKDSKKTPGQITSASFKNLGGFFRERISSPAQEGGIGSVKFSGSFIKPDKIIDTVPDACLQ